MTHNKFQRLFWFVLIFMVTVLLAWILGQIETTWYKWFAGLYIGAGVIAMFLPTTKSK